MLNHKKYIDIKHFEVKSIRGFCEGDHIIIQEKIDGANASFQYDAETDSISCFSRKYELSPENDLRGFYQWVQNLDKKLIRSVLGNNLRMFGEWLVQHTVYYPPERYSDMYCFDVYDTEKKLYLPQNEVKEIVEKLGLNYVPVFYEGEFTSWPDIEKYIGKTGLGGETGEGIIVKNMSRLNNHDDGKVSFYLKLVCENFYEVKKGAELHKKRNDMELIKERMANTALAETVVTRARVEKLLHKMVDDGILPENFSLDNMKVICKNLPSAIYYDCLKETPEIVNRIPNFGAYSNKIAIALAKEIAGEKNE